MKNYLDITAIISMLLAATPTFAFTLKNGYYLAEAGLVASSQSYTQDIAINCLIGNRFTAIDSLSLSGLVGVGYLVKGYDSETFGFDYGLNGFYLSNSVSGLIIQEHLYPNLAYSYKVNHFPLYATAKLHTKTPLDKIALTLDAGLGPNFMQSGHYQEKPLDPIILPDNAFLGHANTTLSAMAGVGLRLPPLSVLSSFEVGYRYFYLGRGELTPRTNELLNTLNTGTNSAHALILTATV